jgi:hypothetical protein
VTVKIGAIQTSHPKIGDRHIEAPPAPSSTIKRVLSELANLPAEAEQKAKTESDLRREIVTLKRELTVQQQSQPKPVVDKAEVEKWRVRACTAEQHITEREHQIISIRKDLIKLDSGIKSVAEGMPGILKLLDTNHQNSEKIPMVIVATQQIRKDKTRIIPLPLRKVATSDNLISLDISRPQQTILNALAAYESLGLESVHRNATAARAGASPRSSAFTNNVSRLSVLGLLKYPQRGFLSLTEDGRNQAQFPDSPISLAELQAGWLRIISRPQAALLKVLLDIYPEQITREELANRAGVSFTSSAFTNNVSRLSTLNALTYPERGFVRGSNLLFPEGLV